MLKIGDEVFHARGAFNRSDRAVVRGLVDDQAVVLYPDSGRYFMAKASDFITVEMRERKEKVEEMLHDVGIQSEIILTFEQAEAITKIVRDAL